MKKYLFLIASLITLLSCTTTNQITESKEDKVVVSNIINEINILGESVINDAPNKISISIKPIDARLFDNTSDLSNYIGGQHRSVVSIIDSVNLEAVDAAGNEFEELSNILGREGISYNDILSISEIIDTDRDAIGQAFIFSDTAIRINSENRVNANNPFSREGRYQAIVELDIQNKSDQPRTVCEDQLAITGGTTSYTNIPTSELLEDFSAGSVQYELLHSTLLNDCKMVPANANIITHLVYPSLYKHDNLVARWDTGNSTIEREFEIERNVITNRYLFSKVEVSGENSRGYRILGNTTTVNYSPSKNFHFIKIGNSLNYVGFEDFYIHDEIDLHSVELFTVRQNRDESIEILRTPITRENIRDGVIIVEE